MKVAEIELTYAAGFSLGGFVHRVHYADLRQAWAAYEEVRNLLQRRADKANDLPHIMELSGLNQLALPLEGIQSVALTDFAKQNAAERGLREEFPYLTWK